MKDLLITFLENHHWVKIILFTIGLIVVVFLLNSVVVALINRFSEENKIKYNLIKSIVLGIAVPIVGMYMWYNYSETPFNELQLITNSRIANGYIIKVEQQSDVVEKNDGRSSALIYFYYYEYNFTLPNGNEFSSDGKEDGYIPEYLSNVDQEPYPIEVEYLENNPQVNRVKGMPSNHTTLYEFFRFTILGGVIVLIICAFFSYHIIKNAKTNYDNEQKSLSDKNNLRKEYDEL